MDTCIIVVEISVEGETVVVGALVDSVQEVFELESQLIEPAPRIGTRWKTDFIEGLGKQDDEFIMILNLEKLISSQEAAFISDFEAASKLVPPAENGRRPRSGCWFLTTTWVWRRPRKNRPDRGRTADRTALFHSTLTERDFYRLAKAIESATGIKMNISKKLLLEGRLRKRLRYHGIASFEEYCARLFEEQELEEEFSCIVDLATTNKTDFFREPRHFENLEKSILPQFLNDPTNRREDPYHVWSAGCSTGEEPYTLAMALSELAPRYPGFNFIIKATDICSTVLEKARLGVYRQEFTDSIPMALRKKYLLKHRDRHNPVVRIAPEIRKLVDFQRRNLLDEQRNFPRYFHLIYCRNVIIYFDRATQQRVLDHLCRRLVPDGYLFLGHSETVNGLDLPLAPVATTVYRKLDEWK